MFFNTTFLSSDEFVNTTSIFSTSQQMDTIGASCAVSHNGNVAAFMSSNNGYIRVYKLISGVWTLYWSSSVLSESGTTYISLSNTGGRLIYGSSGAADGGFNVLVDNGTTFVNDSPALVGGMTASRGLLSADGTRVALGINSSSTLVYLRSGASWSLERAFNDNAELGGMAMDMTQDCTAIARPRSTNATEIYTRSGTTWTLTDTLTRPGSHIGGVPYARFSPDGNWLANMNPNNNTMYVYRKVAGNFVSHSSFVVGVTMSNFAVNNNGSLIRGYNGSVLYTYVLTNNTWVVHSEDRSIENVSGGQFWTGLSNIVDGRVAVFGAANTAGGGRSNTQVDYISSILIT